jgi:hypothetical protein
MSRRFSGNYFRNMESALPPIDSVDDLSIVASDDENSSSAEAEESRTSTSGAVKNAPAELVRKETRAVSYLRYFILSLLLVSAIGISVGFYSITSDAEEGLGSCPAVDSQELELFIHGFEKNMKQVLSDQLRKAFTLSASFSSHVLESGVAQGGFPMQWPYVTIPHFDPRSLAALSSNGVVQVVLAPMVRGTDRDPFETYALLQQQRDCTFEGCQVVRNIYNADGTKVEPGDFTSPIWQMSPNDVTNPGDLLLNQFSDPVWALALTLMQEEGAAVWSGFDYDSVFSDGNIPEMSLFYPIYEDFKQERMVGSVSMRMDLQGFMKSVCPFSTARDIAIVLQVCDDAISFNQNGEKLTYLGIVDTENLEQIRALGESAILEFPSLYTYGQFDSGINTTSCGMSVVLAPSEALESLLPDAGVFSGDTSSRPAILTALVAMTFFVLILTFLIYDWLVERRQAVVINIANKSTAIVENLFPAQVRDRMLQNIEQKKSKAKGLDVDQAGVGDAGATPVEPVNGSTVPTTPTQKPTQVSVKQFLTTDQHGAANDLTSQPIADLFPNTTVLFADISGFTAWASQREPPQVFTLLETLYRSFDVVAKKLKVFKVET